MNIVEAYLKFRGQYIILISGFSGSGKSALGEFIANLFGFELVKLERFEYSKDEFDREENYITLKNNIKVLDWDNIHKSINWNKFTEHINALKSKTGLVITGFGFPTSLLRFEPDVHIHLKTSKKILIEKREKYMETHLDDPFRKLGKDYNSTMVLTLNTVTYPHYLDFMKESKIDKFINGNELSEKGINDEAFSYLMHHTEKWLTDHPRTPTSTQTSQTSQPTQTSYAQIPRPQIPQPQIPQPFIDRNLKNPMYDEYFHTKRKRFDFNEEGIDYPLDYKEEFGEKDINELPDVSGSDSEEIDAEYSEIINGSSEDSGDSESIFLGTFRSDN